MARLLVKKGVTVLSGLAAGIDTEAHQATLDAGGRTVAVLGHGLGRAVYPRENEALAEAIPARGARVSIFFPGTPPTPKTFPMRNVVTSGMGQGTVVIQANATSGARLHHASPSSTERRRSCFEVFSTSTTGRSTSRGKNGAVVVAEVDEVFPYLRESAALAEEWERKGGEVVAGNAEPAVYVQWRMSRVAARGQQQLTFD